MKKVMARVGKTYCKNSLKTNKLCKPQDWFAGVEECKNCKRKL